jgi:hypothetical protein
MRSSVVLAKSRKNSFRAFKTCHVLSITSLCEPASIWVLATTGKLKCKRDVGKNKVVSKKSVVDLVPFEKSGERNAVVIEKKMKEAILNKGNLCCD